MKKFMSNPKYNFIDDPIAEMDYWCAWEDSPQNMMKNQPLIKKTKVGRNDPCTCGSGKKYKKCCLYSNAHLLGTKAPALN